MTEAFLSAVQAPGIITPTPESLNAPTIKLPESCTCSVCIPHEMPWVPFAPVVVRAQPDNLPALAKTLETKLEVWGTQRWRESWKKLVPRSLDSGPDSFVGQVASRTIAGLALELVKADADIDWILAERTNIIHFELIRGELAAEVSRLIEQWRKDTAVRRLQLENLPALVKILNTELDTWGVGRWRDSWRGMLKRGSDNGPNSFVNYLAAKDISDLAADLFEPDADIDKILADGTKIFHFDLIRGELVAEVTRLIDKWRLDTASGATNPVI